MAPQLMETNGPLFRGERRWTMAAVDEFYQEMK